MSSTETYQVPVNGFRTFVIVWITQSVSVFGSALTCFAVAVWLTQVLYPKPEQKPQLAFVLTAIGLTGGLVVVFSIGQLFNPYLLRVEDKTCPDRLATKNGEPPENLNEPAAEPIHHVAPLPTPVT